MWHSLGSIAGGAAPVRATSNETDPARRVSCQTLFFQQIETNAGKIYVCDRATANMITMVGVVAVIPAPTLVGGVAVVLPYVAVTIASSPGALNAADFWLDFDNAQESCLVSAVRN